MVASLLFAVATGISSPAPSPSASSLPVIVHTITSLSCSTLRNVILPVGFVVKKDDEAVGAMSDRLQQIFSSFTGHDAPTRAELMELGASKDATSGASVDQIDPSGQDDSLLYSPEQILKASQIDAIANAIYGNLVLAQQVLDKSTSDTPSGADAKTDEMRKHAQNLILLQRSLADKYENFARTYLNNQNTAWTHDPGEREFVKAYLRALLVGEAASMNSADSGASDYHYMNESERARIGSVADVVQGLRQEEQAFAPEEIDSYNQCNNAHINLEATPSPKPRE